MSEVCRMNVDKKSLNKSSLKKMTFSSSSQNTVDFYSTQLDILLSHLGVKNLILTGVAGDICVLFTADELICGNVTLGYQVIAQLPKRKETMITPFV